MQAVPKAQAIERFIHAVEVAPADELAEYFNELFPANRIDEDKARRDRTVVLEQILGHIRNGLEPEEIVDLWRGIFPGYFRVRFDDEENRLLYNEEPEFV